ncbi:MAG: SUMF1/EgtB/PvdO family nonheme iron enzyme [Candidatus Cloacimonetes bacterium]|nr:SUMF1/EgtB/PvdO family nonheme iron enzyme [Candidatus Cloacimonadota bacterium]
MNVRKKIVHLVTVLLVLLFIASCEKTSVTEAQIGTVSTPVLSLAEGTYNDTQIVTITCATAGATIRYTTNGAVPTYSSAAYTGQLSISRTLTLQARAFKTGMNNSTSVSAEYTINKVITPTINILSGTYPIPQTVTIACETDDASVFYTIDGTEPTTASLLYSAPIIVSSTRTLKVKAFKDGMTDSDVSSATYTIVSIGDFVLVEGGLFNNGTSEVTVSSFSISNCEVTQAAYLQIMGNNPSVFNSVPSKPVENVSWYNAIEYCNRLSMNKGFEPCYSYLNSGTDPDLWPTDWSVNDTLIVNITCNWSATGYRLPTEMEWMFAAKGGNLTPATNYNKYSGTNSLFQLANYAWYNANNVPDGTKAVGTKVSNELGIFDMSGNVWEWVWDYWKSGYSEVPQTNPHVDDNAVYRTLRGGGWLNDADICATSYRGVNTATSHNNYVGFRVCKQPNP